MRSDSKEGTSVEPRETVTLILKEERFEVEKQKLIDKSQYFAALLSANFLWKEYGQTEHIVNYDISSNLLQDFIDWIHHEEIIFTSATITRQRRVDEEELNRLLILLDLSVLFAADQLIKDITERFERYFISPKYAIDMWILTQEINVNVLRDLCLDVCLDRFNELPLDLIYELSRENFIKLIGNINIRATESYLVDITREWQNRHQDFTVSLDILKNKEEKILQSFISSENDLNESERYIHCWDGNDFFELTSFEYPPDMRCFISIDGMQITGRRYDLYLCGGNFSITRSWFNTNVWRYSLISKKWILETVMPVERSHMITVFLKDKLYLVGGEGRDQQELRTIDIYDIYTGVWTSSKVPIPVVLTDKSDHFIFNDKLIVHENMSTYYIYLPDVDVWETKSMLPPFISWDETILTLKHMSCFIDITDEHKMVFRAIAEIACNVKDCKNKVNFYSTKEESARVIYHNPHVVQRQIFSEHDGHFFVSIRFCYFIDTDFLNLKFINVVLYSESDHVVSKKTLHLHNIPIREPRKFESFHSTYETNSIRRFFNLLHPAHLHTTNLDHI